RCSRAAGACRKPAATSSCSSRTPIPRDSDASSSRCEARSGTAEPPRPRPDRIDRMSRCLLGAVWPLAYAASVLLAPKPARAAAPAAPGPADALDGYLTQAELSLQAGETQIAESRYRSAIGEGFLLLGSVDASEGRLDSARDAFRSATLATAD